MRNNQDYYSILGVRRDASVEEIRLAYFDAARKYHPDKNVAPGETELFIEAQEAFEVLSNPKKRSQYDATLPPLKEQFLPIDQRVLFSRSHLLKLNEPQLVYAFLEFLPREGVELPGAPPLNICLILDRSTSMQGQKMDVVKTTARKIIEGLRSTDFFSLVTFSDHAEVVIPADRNTDSQKMYTRIQMIQCTGGTEIYTGLEAGLHEVLRNYQFSSSGHIVLLTDGRTYGDEEKCIALARMAAEKGIPIRCLGIGTEWNDGFLDELASITGGSCLYISRPQDIQQILLKQIKQLSIRFSDETRLEFSLPKNIELHYAFRITPEPCLLPLVSPIQLGPVLKGSTLQVLLELMVNSVGESERLSLLEGKIFITSSIPQVRTITYPFNLQREVKNEPSREPPASEIVSALSKLTLYRMQEQMALEAEAGEYEKAAEHLQRLATHLLSCGERGLARTALIEAEQLGQHKTLSQEGQKEIKYGTRALVNSGERNRYGHLS